MTNQNVVVPDAKQGIDITVAMTLPKSLFSPAVPEPLPAAPGGYFTITRKRFPKMTETGGKTSSWVDSMRDSSPTRVKSTTSLSEPEDKNSWIMREAVKDVARYFPTAIVTGRCRNKGGVLFQPASEFLPMIDEVYNVLLERTKSVPGAKVENNKFCVSVHFRCVEEKMWAILVEQVRSILNDYPKLRLTQGRKVLEIRPTIKWDKGKALEFLLESLGFANSTDVLPVYIGDDQTDEDAFKVLRNRGQGLGILVSKVPKETNASYSLQEPKEVKDFLRRLVEWKRSSLQGQCRV
ncbi:hypothetical protein OIU84_013215 [Salix udensis]|uniref:Trehalose 6-phosphate phosphatase n=1 Tax=Salix udensis TaxID=889485 RepID=A0AAD6JJG9_9ROSI|nr:hypothetical protein OIU84_013215 [Salix udensis]